MKAGIPKIGKTNPHWDSSRDRDSKARDSDKSEPRGPKDQKNSRFRSRLKISSESEIFERATHRGPIFCGGNRDVEIEIFERD